MQKRNSVNGLGVDAPISTAAEIALEKMNAGIDFLEDRKRRLIVRFEEAKAYCSNPPSDTRMDYRLGENLGKLNNFEELQKMWDRCAWPPREAVPDMR